jgi:CheY-like chemotaxis protein
MALATECKVLVVDDHYDSAEIVSVILEQLGYQATVAETYQLALAAARSSKFDILVCDIALPDGDGCVLLTEVKTMYPVRAIAFTGHGYPIHRKRCEEAGFDAFLLKPVRLEELTQTIRAVSASLPCLDGMGQAAVPA